MLAICAALFMANPAQAATTTVSPCDEAALRAAVANAAPGDTLTFTCSGTVTLTDAGGGPISIGKNLTIDGSGQSVTISGGGSVGVIKIGTGVTVTLSHLTIVVAAAGSSSPSAVVSLTGTGTLQRLEALASSTQPANPGKLPLAWLVAGLSTLPLAADGLLWVGAVCL